MNRLWLLRGTATGLPKVAGGPVMFEAESSWVTETPRPSQLQSTKNLEADLAAAMLDTDPDFRALVEQLPDTHWARYDLSAARLGWEMHKLRGAT